MMRWLTVSSLTIGVCLLALAGYLYPSPPVDAGLAASKIDVLPLQGLSVGKELTHRVKIPNSKAWRRLIEDWGDPEFIIGIETTTKASQFRCFSDEKVNIQLMDTSGHGLPATPTQSAPYGYVAECGLVGLSFRAAPGSELVMRVTAQRPASSSAGDLIVMPYWRYEKDRIAGNLIAPAFFRVAIAVGTAGFACLMVCVWSYWVIVRKPRHA